MIPLTHGKVAIVDAADYPRLSRQKWHFAVRGDACITRTRNGRKAQIKMHRYLLNPPADKVVDHINRNPLDNRRCNIRLADKSQNAANTTKQRANSGFRGVFHCRSTNRFHAYIKRVDKREYLGSFPSAIEAARARDERGRELFGEFYCPSVPCVEKEGLFEYGLGQLAKATAAPRG